MSIPKRVPSHDGWEDLIAHHAKRSTVSEELADLRDRLDGIEFELERKRDIELLSRDVRAYLDDKRNELWDLRLFRYAVAGIALLCIGFVGYTLFSEMWSGFQTIGKVVKNELVLAAYVAASLAFVLGILLVLLRGVFGAIKDAENQPYLPPQLQEIYDLLKKLGS